LRHDIIVIDELGYLPFSQSGGQLPFHLISKLYENTVSVRGTSPCGEWLINSGNTS
jgi:DNA replication protein DnaC